MAEVFQPRYIAYAASMGLLPDEALVADGERWPGGIMTGFTLWIHEQWRLWAESSGARAIDDRDGWSMAQHAAFDAWLRLRYLTRPVYGRARTFDDWLSANGIDPASLPGDAAEATFIGQSVFLRQRTGREKGVQESLAKAVERKHWLERQYREQVPVLVVGRRDVDMAREEDRAWARTQRRRERVRRREEVVKGG